ncbi:MAG: futalosine hydrolase [Desulfovibrionaceae bacterium]|nr:futalosine hydrolase [Desulfovibrionaceae bacterium]
MALLFVTPTQEELFALFSHTLPHADLQAARTKGQSSNLLMQAPKKLLGRDDVYLSLTGVGPVNAAFATGLAIGALTAKGVTLEALLLFGLAGAYDLTRYPLCSLCRITQEIWPEYGLNDGHSVIAEAFKWPQWQKEDGPIYDRLSLSDPDTKGLPSGLTDSSFLTAESVTVAGVSASYERARTLWDTYHAPLENMEGFAVAYSAMRAGIPVAEIRAVSNKVGPRRADEKDFPGSLAKLGDILPTLNLI